MYAIANGLPAKRSTIDEYESVGRQSTVDVNETVDTSLTYTVLNINAIEDRHLYTAVNTAVNTDAANNNTDPCDPTYVNTGAANMSPDSFTTSGEVVRNCTASSSGDNYSHSYTNLAVDHYLNV